MKEKKLIGYILIFCFFLYIIFYFIKDNNSNYKATFLDDELDIIFPHKIFLKSYEIKDYEKNELGEYKKILGREIYQDIDKIKIENISDLGIKLNHAYFYTMFQEDEKKPNSRLKSFGFCIKKDTVLIQNSNEKDFNFINECKQ